MPLEVELEMPERYSLWRHMMERNMPWCSHQSKVAEEGGGVVGMTARGRRQARQNILATATHTCTVRSVAYAWAETLSLQQSHQGRAAKLSPSISHLPP
jgi:hypothetical protein